MSDMGKRALESHMNSDKHKRNVSAKVPSISSYFKKPTAPSKTSVPNSADTDTDTQASYCATATEINRIPVASQMLTHYVRKDDVLKAEILWALKVIESHFSYNSSRNIVDLLKMMLRDSKIVEKLCLCSTKLAYLITHGLAPFFHDELLKLISSKYVTCFDEAFNELFKKGQLDIVIRFWDSSMNKVCSLYLSRSFMGHSTAEGIMNNFVEASSEMKLCNLVQVSMNSPNVNWSFLEQLSSDLHDAYGTTMLFLGSCGLHVINSSLTTGHKAANWKVQVQLKSFFKLFKDSPARRADYIDFTGCNQFPKTF